MFRTAAFIACLAAPMATHAQEQGASAGPEIETVIRAQLQDFTERDLDAAFGYATPNLQDFFGSPEVFGDMVANGFPMVWDNADARMIDRQNFDGVEVQLVQIEDATGGFHMLAYAMVQTDEGWRIDAVQIGAATRCRCLRPDRFDGI